MIRLVKLFFVLPALAGLFAFANSTGITAAVSEAAGIEIPDGFRIPGLQEAVDASNTVNAARDAAIRKVAEIAAQKAMEEAERKGYGPEKVKQAGRDAAQRAVKDYIAKNPSKDSDGDGEVTTAEYLRAVSEDAVKRIISIIPGSGGNKTEAPDPASTSGVTDKQVKTARAAAHGNRTTWAAARKALAGIPVKGRAPKTGYDRDEFGSEWSDAAGQFPYSRNGCDTRNDILKRDLLADKFKAGTKNCVVESGVLAYERYTGKTRVKFVKGGAYANQFDIEHLVPLSWAWQHGAQKWSEAKRAEIANDPINLFAADPSSNRQKGDSGPGAWLPPNKAYRCGYVSHFTRVVDTYDLWITKGDRDAIARVLNDCLA